jgi:tetratricopeptide (TPR) repeat protein
MPVNVDSLLALAESAVSKRRLAAACVRYRRVLAAEPGNPRASMGLGSALLERGRFAEALPALRYAIDAGMGGDDAQLKLGRCLRGLGQTQAAVTELEKVAPGSPRRADACDLAGQTYADRKDAAGSDWFARALDANPAYLPARVHWAALLDELGQPQKSVEHLEAALTAATDNFMVYQALDGVLRRLPNADAAIERLDRIVRSQPPAMDAKWGYTLLEFGKTDLALTLALATLDAESKPSTVGTPPLMSLPVFVAQQAGIATGHIFTGIERTFTPWDPLMRLVLKIVDRRPSSLADVEKRLATLDPAIEARWAEALHQERRYEQAARHAANALSRDLGNVALFQVFGEVVKDVADRATRGLLIDTIERAVIQSGDERARAWWGSTLFGLGNLDQARQFLEPLVTSSASVQASVYLARIAAVREEFDAAAAYYVDALTPATSDGDTVGLLLSAIGDLAPRLTRREGVLEKVAAFLNGFPDTSAHLTWATHLARLGEDEAAVRRLDITLQHGLTPLMAFEVAPGDGDWAQRLPRLRARLEAIARAESSAAVKSSYARMLTTIGRHEEAADYFTQAAALDVDDSTSVGEAAAALARAGKRADALQRYEAATVDGALDDAAYDQWAHTLRDFDVESGVSHTLAQWLGANVLAGESMDWAALDAATTVQQRRVNKLADAVCRDVDTGAPFMHCGITLGNHGYHDIAARMFERAEQLAPTLDYAPLNLGWALMVLERYDEALQACDRAIKQLTANRSIDGVFKAHYFRGLVYVAREERLPASAAFEQAFASIEAAPEMIAADDRVRVYLSWATLLADERRYDEAFEKLRHAAGQPTGQFWVRFREGDILMRMRRHGEAIAHFRSGSAPPEDDDYRAYPPHVIAEALEAQGRYTAARPEWKTALETYQSKFAGALRRRDVNYCLNFAQALVEADRDFVRASIVLAAARVFDARQHAVHVALANVLREIARTPRAHPRARRSLPQVILRRPAAVPASYDEPDLQARARWQAWDTGKTAERILLARRKSGETVATCVELGELYSVIDEDEPAKEAFQAALARDADCIRAYVGLGHIALRAGDFTEAIRSYRAALRRAPTDLTTRAALARAQLRAGSLEDAETEYQQLRELADPDPDTMIGLAETFIETADRRRRDNDRRGAVAKYTGAIEQLTGAIALYDRPEERHGSIATLGAARYLRGYAQLQLGRIRGVAEARRLTGRAREDFEACKQVNAAARRALDRITEERQSTAARTRIERSAPMLITTGALIILVYAIVAVIAGRPVYGPTLMISDQTIALSKIPADMGAKLLPLRSEAFTNSQALLDRLTRVLGEADAQRVGPAILRHTEEVFRQSWQPITLETFAALAFGSLIFIVAAAYLRDLTSLKLPGVQLEKSAADRRDDATAVPIEIPFEQQTLGVSPKN